MNHVSTFSCRPFELITGADDWSASVPLAFVVTRFLTASETLCAPVNGECWCGVHGWQSQKGSNPAPLDCISWDPLTDLVAIKSGGSKSRRCLLLTAY